MVLRCCSVVRDCVANHILILSLCPTSKVRIFWYQQSAIYTGFKILYASTPSSNYHIIAQVHRNEELSIILLFSLFLTVLCNTCEAKKCRPSGIVRGKKTPPGPCDQGDTNCCQAGKSYPTYHCSPPVSKRTKAYLTLDSSDDGGDTPSCDNRYHPDDTPVVALSTGWFNNGGMCLKNITISGNGRSVVAVVVDECDSTIGCDMDTDYQPPCANNVVDASKAVWKALGVPLGDWGGMDITWSTA